MPSIIHSQCSKAKAYKGQNPLYGHACAAFSITLLHTECDLQEVISRTYHQLKQHCILHRSVFG